MGVKAQDLICRNRMIGSASGAAVASMARDSVRVVPIWADRVDPVVLADPMRQGADPEDRAVEADLGPAVLEAAAVHLRAAALAVAADAAGGVADSVDREDLGDAVGLGDG